MGQDNGWTIRLCGPVGVEVAGGSRAAALPGRQGRLLFAYLVLNRERDCGRPELIDLLWPERPPAAADTALSALLSKLRRALGEGALVGRSELRLSPPGQIWVDLEQAAAATASAEAAIDAHDWLAAADRARAALGVDLQTFLPDCEGQWVAEQRRALEAVRLRALEVVAEAGLRRGGRELGPAEQAVRSAIAAAPFRESSHRLLMEIHEANGNPAEALRAFEELRTLLRDELGTAPGPSALAVHERLLRGEAPAAAGSARAGVISVTSWPTPLAAALDRQALVGRADELAFLEERWREATGGARQLVLLAGDAGIGKTRLTAELGRRAHDDGAIVLYGRFDEEALALYQPVVEMVRGWSSGASLEPLRERLGVRAAELAILFPELGPVPEAMAAPAPRVDDPDARRLRFFDAVGALLAEAGTDAPLVLVFDDLHWADRPTLQLVRHLVRAPQPRRVLFLGTYRDAELGPAHPLYELMGDVRREGMLRRREVEGLAEEEVAELVEALCSAKPEQTFVRALHGETEGNPFFIEEVVRHMGEAVREQNANISLTDAGVPEGVLEVTARRLRRLCVESRQALQVAAVIGREFDYDVLEAVAPLEDETLIGALEEGVQARVLREAGRVGRYAFAHALVRATLYDGLSKLRRARLHGRVGEAIARLRSADLDPHLPQLAHHFEQAAPVEQPERAIDFALAAARRADRLLAWEEAAQHYRAALRARDLTGAADDRIRAELLLALGASEDRAGMEEDARETFRSAAGTARRLADAPLLGRAALGFAGQWSILGRVDEARLALLEEALAALGDEDSPLRARLLARLALELYYSGEPERRLVLSEQAVALARRLGDPRTLAACLDARHYALWRPENVNERLEVAAELRRVAEETGDPELELEGAGWTVVDLLELGDVQGADIQIAAASKLAGALQRPIWLWWTSLLQCTRAQLAGRFDEAERLANEALEIGRHGQAENAVNYYAMAMFNIRREQGRLDEVEPSVRRFIELYPALVAWRAALALLLVEVDRREGARVEFEALAITGFDTVPRDANWLIAVTLLAEVCGALGDGERAAHLYELLAPYSGRNVVVGRVATCNGAASRLLGSLAAAMGSYELAEGHFIEAQALHARMGARPWAARTNVAYAEVLLARRRRGDKARARELLADAVVVADALGMPVVAERARALVPAGSAGPGGRVAARAR